MAVVDSLEIRIKQDVAATNKELDKMIDRLNGVSRAVGGIDLKKLSGTGMTGMTSKLSASLRSVATSAHSARTSFIGLGKAGQSTNSIMTSLWSTLRRFVGIYAIFRGLKYAVEQYSNLVEVQNRVDVVFGNSKKAIEDWAATSRTAYGVSALSAKTIASTYQAMGTAMGYSQGEMADMSVSLTQLAADMASFYDRDVEDIATDLNAVFTGQTRPLRKYGLDLTQATLAEWALKNGLDADVKSMTQAEKMMLRYKYVMAQTTAAQGDFARTQYTFANQWRVLKQNLTAFAVSVGEVIAQTIRPLIIWLNKVMERVIVVAKTIVNALGKIFGWEMQVSGGSASSDEVADLAENLGDVGSAADDASKGVDGVKKSVDKLKNTILGFDELNVLNDVDENTSTGGSGGSGGGGTGIGSPASQFADEVETSIVKAGTPIWEKYKSSIDSLRELGKYIADALTDAMNSIDWFSIYDKAKNFGKGLAEFLNGLITPELFRALGRTIAGALNTALFARNEFFKNFDFSNLGESIASGINGFFMRFRWDIKGENFALLINGIADSIISAAGNIKWDEMGRRMALGLQRFVSTIRGSELGRAANMLADGVLKAINSYLDEVPWGEIGDKIVDFLNNINWKKKFDGIGDIIAKAINGAVNVGINVFKFNWGEVGKQLGRSFTRFMQKIDGTDLGHAISAGILAMLNFINGAISETDWYKVGNTIRDMLKGLKWKEILYAVAEVFWNALNGALLTAAGIFDSKILETKINEASKTFTPLTEAISKLLDALRPAGEGFMDGFVHGLGMVIDLGATVITGIAKAIEKLAIAIKLIPNDILESIGAGLGTIAAALTTISLANGAANVVSKVAKGLAGGAAAGGAGGAAAAGASGATGASWLSKIFGGTTFLEKLGMGGALALGPTLAWFTKKQTETEEFYEEKDAVDALAGAYKNLGGTSTKAGFLSSFRADDKLRNLGDKYSSGELFKFITKDLEKAQADFDKYYGNIGNKTVSFVDVVKQALQEADDGAYQLPEIYRSAFQQFIASQNGAAVSSQQAWRAISASASQGASATQAATDSTSNSWSMLGGRLSGLTEMTKYKFSDTSAAADAMYASLNGSATNVGVSYDNLKNSTKRSFEAMTGSIGTATLEAVDSVKTGSSYISGDVDSMGNNVRKSGSSFTELKDTSQREMTTTESGVKQKNSSILSSFKSAWTGSYGAVALQLGLMNIVIAAEMLAMKLLMGGYEKTMKETANRAIAQPIKYAADSAIRSLREMPSQASDALYSFSETVRRLVSIDLSNEGRNAAWSFGQGIQSVYIPMPHIRVNASAWADADRYGYNMDSYVEWYANGGFPDRGELFIANENGVPEMVGKIGGAPAVANNQQITDAIREAVVEGLMNAGGGDSSPIEVTIKADSETLYRTTLKGKKKYDLRFA